MSDAEPFDLRPRGVHVASARMKEEDSICLRVQQASGECKPGDFEEDSTQCHTIGQLKSKQAREIKSILRKKKGSSEACWTITRTDDYMLKATAISMVDILRELHNLPKVSPK